MRADFGIGNAMKIPDYINASAPTNITAVTLTDKASRHLPVTLARSVIEAMNYHLNISSECVKEICGQIGGSVSYGEKLTKHQKYFVRLLPIFSRCLS